MIWGTIFGNIQVVVSHAIFYILLQPNEMIQLRHIFYRMGCNQHFLKSVWRISETKPGGRVETSCRLSAFAGESPSYSTDLFGEGIPDNRSLQADGVCRKRLFLWNNIVPTKKERLLESWRDTPRKFNMEPENEPLEEEIPMKNHHF